MLIEYNKYCRNVQVVKRDQKKKSLIKNKQTLMIIQASQDINGNGSFYGHIKNDEQYTRPIYLIADLITKVAHLGINCDIKANKLKVFICGYRKF